jgi:hypothetical protein
MQTSSCEVEATLIFKTTARYKLQLHIQSIQATYSLMNMQTMLRKW